jgi:hypothetical protein
VLVILFVLIEKSDGQLGLVAAKGLLSLFGWLIA